MERISKQRVNYLLNNLSGGIYKESKKEAFFMSDRDRDERVEVDKNINRNEPSKVGSTFIKYAAYIVILLIVLYFIINYLLPMI